jgi:hypothetical protein
LGVVGVIVILGAAFDIYNHWHKSGKMREQKTSGALIVLRSLITAGKYLVKLYQRRLA